MHLADESVMQERRIETRLLCAELVEVIWSEKSGKQRRKVANLEDISLSGACLQMENHLLRETPVTIRYGDGKLVGVVRYCFYRDFGYFVGVQFTDGCKWSTKHFKPKHLMNPEKLLHLAIQRYESEKVETAL